MPPRLRILSIAPIGGDIGGATMASRVLHEELTRREDVDLIAVDSHRFKHGRLGQLISTLYVLGALLRHLPSTQVIVLNASVGRLQLMGPVIATLGRLSRRPVVLRAFGGSLGRQVVERPRTYRYLLAHAALLLEPRVTMADLRDAFPGARVYWFANHRPLRNPQASTPASDSRFAYFGRVNSKKVLGLLRAAAPHAQCEWGIDLFGPVDGDAFDDGGIPEVAVLKGPIPHAEVPSTMECYRATVLPSGYDTEGYPGAIIESFISGVPVIATCGGFIPEIVEDGVNGLLCKPDDPEGFARALDRLATDPELVERLREGARRSAADFDSERWASRFVDICREAVGLDPQGTSER